MHAILSYRGNGHRPPDRPLQTRPITKAYTAPQLASAQRNYENFGYSTAFGTLRFCR